MKRGVILVLALAGFSLPGCAGVIRFLDGFFTRGELVEESYAAHKTVRRATLNPQSPSIIYQDTRGSLSYPSPVIHDLARNLDFGRVVPVEAEACETHVLIPLSLIATQQMLIPDVDVTRGNKGYELARERIQQDYQVTDIFDLRVDVRQRKIWNVYERECLLIHALGVK
jgi:hypothetical protein